MNAPIQVSTFKWKLAFMLEMCGPEKECAVLMPVDIPTDASCQPEPGPDLSVGSWGMAPSQ